MKQHYQRPDLPHPHGGLIYKAFWLCAPLSAMGAHNRQLLEDAKQELFLLALMVQGLESKELMSAVQRSGYKFWKNAGYRKARDGKQNACWERKETELELQNEEQFSA